MRYFDKNMAETIGVRLTMLRIDSGLSQTEISLKIGVSAKAVSSWETGINIPQVNKLIALSELYKSSVDWILKGKEYGRQTF